jgi:hypothetical protein
MSHGDDHYSVIVLVRPLDAFTCIPDEDCNPLFLNPINANKRKAAQFSVQGDCGRLAANEYYDELKLTLEYYDVLYTKRVDAGETPLCPRMWHHETNMHGVTTGLGSIIGRGGADKKELFKSILFGVEVWESFGMSLLDFIKQSGGTDNASHDEFKRTVFMPMILPMLEGICEELHKLNLCGMATFILETLPCGSSQTPAQVFTTW